MPDIQDSVPTQLPSSKQLVRSTIIALIVASVLLACVVLPAEYGVDPTGVGSLLGLTEMGRIKQSLAEEARLADAAEDASPAVVDTTRSPAVPSGSAAPAPAASATDTAPAPRSDVLTIELAPNQGREIKLAMREGERVSFSWSTDRGVVNYDTHADSEVPRRDYHGYAKGTGVAKDQGELVAAFDGWHGWFWRNRGSGPVTVTLRTEGAYSDIKEPE